jgi:LDH2 family malate/lactate/ureidoglycolate dehydrogenase
VLRSTPSTATIDADNGLGLVVGPRVNDLHGEGRDAGSGWISVCNSNHYGIAGWYAMRGSTEISSTGP